MIDGVISSDLPFVGRQNIIKTYKENLSRAINNEGNVIVISGPPGIGKTRILRELLNLSDKTSIFTCYIRIENSSGLYEFFDCVLDSFLRRPRISTLVPLVINENFYNIFVQRFPILKSVFPYEPKATSEINITLESGFQLLQNLTRLYPVVFLLDDFHTANREIKDLINFLSVNIFNMPILMVLGTRTDDRIAGWISSLKSTSPLLQIDLEPLATEEIHKLNQLMFENELPDRFFDWVYYRTQGNPLFTKEFLLFLINKGIIFFDTEKQSWIVTEGYAEIEFPNTLFNIIKQQFDTLSSNEQNFVKLASLINQYSFRPDMLNYNITSDEMDDILQTRFIFKIQNQYAFAHPLIKEAIYSLIPSKDKKNLHSKLGDFLLKNNAKEEALNQFISAGIESNKLLKLLINFVTELKKRKETKKALFYEEKALKLISSNPSLLTPGLLRFFVDSANSLRRAGYYYDALHYYNIALKLLKRFPIRELKKIIPFIYKDMTFAQLRLGKNEEALKITEKMKQFVKSTSAKPDPNTILTLETNRAFAYANLGNFKKALELANELKQKYEKSSDLNQNFRIHYCVATVYHRMGEWNKALPWAEKALYFAKKIGDERYISALSGNIGIAYMFTGNFKDAYEFLSSHQEASIRNGWTREQFMSYLNFGNLYLFQGYLNRAEDEFNKALKIAERLNLKPDLFWIYHSYTYLYIVKNDCKTSREFLKRLFEYSGKHHFQRLYYLCEGLILSLEKNRKDLKKLIDILQKDSNGIEEEYLLLKGFVDLPDKSALDIIKMAIEMVSKKENYGKLIQFAVITHNVLNQYDVLKREMQHYKNLIIEFTQKYNMRGWLDMLSSEKKKIDITPLKISTFGKLSIELPDKRIVEEREWQWAKPRQLFAILINAYLKKQEMTRDKIGLLLWPELSRDKLANNFHVCLNQLKSVIGKDYVELRERTYRLTQVEIDAEKFEGQITQAEQLLNDGKIHSAEQNLTEAIKLYKGKFLEGLYDDWILEMRDYLSERFRHAVFALGDIYLKKAQSNSALGLATRLLVAEPLDEEAHRFLMRCYLQSGEKAKAIAQYKRCESIFKKELGCEPSEKTKDLYRSLL